MPRSFLLAAADDRDGDRPLPAAGSVRVPGLPRRSAPGSAAAGSKLPAAGPAPLPRCRGGGLKAVGGDRGRRHLCREEVSGGQVDGNNGRARSLSGSLPALSFFRSLAFSGWTSNLLPNDASPALRVQTALQ